jgi:hypothetical protein
VTASGPESSGGKSPPKGRWAWAKRPAEWAGFIAALLVFGCGLVLLWGIWDGNPVAAPFTRVGGETSVETAVDASTKGAAAARLAALLAALLAAVQARGALHSELQEFAISEGGWTRFVVASSANLRPECPAVIQLARVPIRSRLPSGSRSKTSGPQGICSTAAPNSFAIASRSRRRRQIRVSGRASPVCSDRNSRTGPRVIDTKAGKPGSKRYSRSWAKPRR